MRLNRGTAGGSLWLNHVAVEELKSEGIVSGNRKTLKGNRGKHFRNLLLCYYINNLLKFCKLLISLLFNSPRDHVQRRITQKAFYAHDNGSFAVDFRVDEFQVKSVPVAGHLGRMRRERRGS